MIIDPADLSVRDTYKLMISSIVPRPIAWVSTRSRAGIDNLAPFSYFNGVTSKPPTLSLGIGRRRWQGELVAKDTLRNIEETQEFVVHVSTEKLAALVNASSAELPPDVSEIEELGLTTVASDIVRPLRVVESPVAFECVLDQVVEVGEKPGGALVLGTIVRFHVDDSVWDESAGAVDPERLEPVARLGGQNWARGFEIFEQERPDWKSG